ncbi:MAG: UDP-glucose dehydrogenase family protein [Candidatus Tyrphobacter sp.]
MLQRLVPNASSRERGEKPRRIAVIGAGYVGLVTGACFAELGNVVACLDNDVQRIAALRRCEAPFFERNLHEMIVRNQRAGRLTFSDDIPGGVRASDIVFIAVGTPADESGNVDLSAVREAAATIGSVLNGPKVVVLKSTVPVGTCEIVSEIIAEDAAGRHHVDVVSNPEFLREGSAVSDFMRPNRIVIGTGSANAEAILRALYASLNAPFVIVDTRTSEMIKYAANAFLATRISFINEIANICDLVDADVKAVCLGIGPDRRIGSQYMSPGIGYGGSCFPKDVRALEGMARSRGYDATLLRSVEAVNSAQIDRSVAKVVKVAGGSIDGKAIAILGLSFKPNTSDTREAPALRLIDAFVRRGAKVTAHDPSAIESARAILNGKVTYCSQMYEAMRGVDVVVLATEWDEYKRIDFAMMKKLMRGNTVFDGRNLFDPGDVLAAGLQYVGVGREVAHEGARARRGSVSVMGHA